SVGGTAGGDATTLGDTITIRQDGNNTIRGGLGADTISLRNGTDTVMGDNGVVELDAVGDKFKEVKTLSRFSAGGGSIVDLGGNDVISMLGGDKIALGG